jgi:hypothetical protein
MARLRRLAWFLLAAAILYFAWRGVLRGAFESHDLMFGYAGAQAWLRGLDPYDPAVISGLMATQAGSLGDVAGGFRNVYFPPTLLTFLPISFTEWQVARLLALAIDVGAVAVIVLGVIRLLDWPMASTRAILLAAFLLALAPIHTTVAEGQTAVVATAMLVGAMLAERSAHPFVAGLLYGLATAVKVQLGLPFVAYLVWRRRWRAAAAATAAVAALSVLAIARMGAASVPWLGSWLANLAWASGPGGINDASPQNPGSYAFVNLQYPLQTLLGRSPLADPITYLIVGLAALALVWLVRGGRPRQELLALAVVAVLCLIVTYHRYYDAVLLALPIAWGFAAVSTPLRRFGLAVLVLCAYFLVPVQTALYALQTAGVLPSALVDSVIWRSVLMPSQAWALVFLAAVLLAAARKGEALAAGGETPAAVTVTPARGAPSRGAPA